MLFVSLAIRVNEWTDLFLFLWFFQMSAIDRTFFDIPEARWSCVTKRVTLYFILFLECFGKNSSRFLGPQEGSNAKTLVVFSDIQQRKKKKQQTNKQKTNTSLPYLPSLTKVLGSIYFYLKKSIVLVSKFSSVLTENFCLHMRVVLGRVGGGEVRGSSEWSISRHRLPNKNIWCNKKMTCLSADIGSLLSRNSNRVSPVNDKVTILQYCTPIKLRSIVFGKFALARP